MKNDPVDGQQIFRVDRFKVPAAARAEFVDRSYAAHQKLRTLPGFVEDFLLQSPSDNGATNFVTIVVWKDAAAFDAAKAVMQQHYLHIGYNPGQVLKRLGIEADMAAYTELGD